MDEEQKPLFGELDDSLTTLVSEEKILNTQLQKALDAQASKAEKVGDIQKRLVNIRKAKKNVEAILAEEAKKEPPAVDPAESKTGRAKRIKKAALEQLQKVAGGRTDLGMAAAAKKKADPFAEDQV